MSKSPEEMAAQWLGGLGTKVIYAAVILAIVGTLMTAVSMSAARDEAASAEVEIQKAVQLATEVQYLCTDREFEVRNPEPCHRAAELLANPSPTSGSGSGGEGSDGKDIVEAVGIPR